MMYLETENQYYKNNRGQHMVGTLFPLQAPHASSRRDLY